MTSDVRIAQAIGTIGCAAAAGGIATLSILNIPNLALPPRHPGNKTLTQDTAPGTPTAHLTHQWLDLYDRGKKIFPGIAGAASLANLYAMWSLRDSPAPAPALVGSSWSGVYAIAVVVTMSIAPFTVFAMGKTNGRLRAHAVRGDGAESEGTEGMVVGAKEEAKWEKEDGEVPALLKKWAKLNLIRAVFPLVGAGIGFYAAVGSWVLP
ncbi:uncharacterized protein N7511_010508 [Penicillium nucicola]|uniref:uncharacterized protein n=1 Tax=Penicillium nucicola TaxID=1850975 RepID=UPI0025459B33|nr:uncharacterized protein N7511_010508 [Penicillium nucicola]KAJ5748812.1 hypothetical protein N7511_010508 [Penicillium nucicola]